LSESSDNLTGSLGLRAAFLQCSQNLVIIALSGFNQALTGLSVCSDRSQRLVQLMGQACGHFTQRTEAPELGQSFPRLMYFLFGPLSFRYVPNYTDKSGLIIRWNLANGEIDRKNRTAFTLTLSFTADSDYPGFAGFKIVTNIAVVFASVRLGHQKRHIFPENFPRTESENDLRSRIERLNATPMINYDNGINGRIEQRFPLGCGIRIVICRWPFRAIWHKYNPGYSYA
jgi:hypothetical protein